MKIEQQIYILELELKVNNLIFSLIFIVWVFFFRMNLIVLFENGVFIYQKWICKRKYFEERKEKEPVIKLLFISVQTKTISTIEENQKNQASFHPALDVFTKIFAGIMQQQQQPSTVPITGTNLNNIDWINFIYLF